MAPGYMSISFLTSGLPGAEQITLNMLQTRRQSITTLSLGYLETSTLPGQPHLIEYRNECIR